MCHQGWSHLTKTFIRGANNNKYKPATKIKFCALVKIVDFIEQHIIVPLRDVWEIYATSCREDYMYLKLKSPKYIYNSSDARDFFLKHMPLIVVYKYSEHGPQAHLTKRLEGVCWTKLIENLAWPTTDQLKGNTLQQMEHFFVPALGFASSARDRNLLKCMLALICGTSAVSKTFGCHKGLLKKKMKQTEIQIEKFQEIKMSSVSSFEAKKRKLEVDMRQKGSGRKFMADQYPELSSCMIKLFDSCGSGLQCHPRLICETLFVDKQHWLDMPRAVSIINQVYGIPIALSTAYTYTNNFRQKSIQAKRHHENTAKNPDVSLKRPTRDGDAKPSINQHFAMADLQYSLRSMDGGCILARDDKALVHTDVEVVQRPSKSWVKVQYSDHDWEKDSTRTLAVTTYQFVSVDTIYEEEQLQSVIAGVSVSKTRIRGNGVSLVKIHFLEATTAFRHMNELLYLMSLDKYQKYFLQNSKFVPEMLVTVDKGGDERPRNKITQFCVSILRFILDLDKLKCQSLAEGSSKFHSVERLHTAENRALSQDGPISSRVIHADETNIGVWNSTKFLENMNYAREEAIRRLQKVPYAKDTIDGYAPPPESDWVFPMEYKEKINYFLKGEDDHRKENNFVIKPSGPIWEQLCNMYALNRDVSKGAYHIFMYMRDFSTLSHYSFAAYRPNENWRGKPLKRYEIQPIIDINRLPEYHYLPYEEAVKVVDELCDSQGTIPEFIEMPDFFLPSRNIKYVLEHSPHDLDINLSTISQLVGVQTDDITAYVIKIKEKEKMKEERKRVVESFRESTPLGKLNMVELKTLLNEHFKYKCHSSLKVKADYLVVISEEMKKISMTMNDLALVVKRLFKK